MVQKVLSNYLTEEYPEIKQKILKNCLKELIVQSEQKQAQLKNDSYFNLAQWQTIKQLIGTEDLLSQLKSLNYESKPNKAEKELKKIKIDSEQSYIIPITEPLFQKEKSLSEIRFRILRMLRGFCRKQYDQSHCGVETLQLLTLSIESQEPANPLNLWESVFSYFTNFGVIRFLFRMKDFILIGMLIKNYIAQHVAYVYEVTSVFVVTLIEVSKLLQQIPYNKEDLEEIQKEINSEKQGAEIYLFSLSEHFPELIRAIQNKRAAYNVLSAQKQILGQYKLKGFLNEHQYLTQIKHVDRKILKLNSISFKLELPSFHSIVMECPLFSCLKKNEIVAILASHHEKHFNKDQVIYAKSFPCLEVFIIRKGSLVDSLTTEFYSRKGIGAILSCANLIIPEPMAVSTARTLSPVIAHAIPRDVIIKLMEINQIFEEHIYKQAVFYFVNIYKEKAMQLANIEESILNQFISSSNFKKLTTGQQILLNHGGYLFYGEIQTQISQEEYLNLNYERYSDFNYIYPQIKYFICNRNTILLQFVEELPGQLDVSAERISVTNQFVHEQKVDKEFIELLMSGQI